LQLADFVSTLGAAEELLSRTDEGVGASSAIAAASAIT
jgi:hypothetical protein